VPARFARRPWQSPRLWVVVFAGSLDLATKIMIYKILLQSREKTHSIQEAHLRGELDPERSVFRDPLTQAARAQRPHLSILHKMFAAFSVNHGSAKGEVPSYAFWFHFRYLFGSIFLSVPPQVRYKYVSVSYRFRTEKEKSHMDTIWDQMPRFGARACFLLSWIPARRFDPHRS